MDKILVMAEFEIIRTVNDSNECPSEPGRDCGDECYPDCDCNCVDGDCCSDT